MRSCSCSQVQTLLEKIARNARIGIPEFDVPPLFQFKNLVEQLAGKWGRQMIVSLVKFLQKKHFIIRNRDAQFILPQVNEAVSGISELGLFIARGHRMIMLPVFYQWLLNIRQVPAP